MRIFEKVKAKFTELKTKVSNKVALVVATVSAAVAVVPVSASAATGGGIDFSTTTGIQVAPTDVVSTGFSFANMFGPYTTLVLGVIFAPVAIGFIIWLWRKLPKFGGGKA